MTITDEMCHAAYVELAARNRTTPLIIVRLALKAAEAVRPASQELAELRERYPDALLQAEHLGEQLEQARATIAEWKQVTCCGSPEGVTRDRGEHAPSAPPEPDTRPLQVTEDEWRKYMSMHSDLPPLDQLNSILALRQPEPTHSGDAQVIWLHQTIADLRAEVEDLQRKLSEAFDSDVRSGHEMLERIRGLRLDLLAKENALAAERSAHEATLAAANNERGYMGELIRNQRERLNGVEAERDVARFNLAHERIAHGAARSELSDARGRCEYWASRAEAAETKLDALRKACETSKRDVVMDGVTLENSSPEVVLDLARKLEGIGCTSVECIRFEGHPDGTWGMRPEPAAEPDLREQVRKLVDESAQCKRAAVVAWIGLRDGMTGAEIATKVLAALDGKEADPE
jgi:hypothetical protein